MREMAFEPVDETNTDMLNKESAFEEDEPESDIAAECSTERSQEEPSRYKRLSKFKMETIAVGPNGQLEFGPVLPVFITPVL